MKQTNNKKEAQTASFLLTNYLKIFILFLIYFLNFQNLHFQQA